MEVFFDLKDGLKTTFQGSFVLPAKKNKSGRVTQVNK